MEYVGHLIGVNGKQVDPAKVAQIQEWHVPHNACQLLSFLCIDDKSNRFQEGCVLVVAHVTSLTLKEVAWERTAVCQIDLAPLRVYS